MASNERNHVETNKEIQFSTKSYKNQVRERRKRKQSCERM